jgi:pilus assembly protein TadC
LAKEEYFAICFRGFVYKLISAIVILTLILYLLKIKYFYLFAIGGSLLFSLFILFNQLTYPKIYNGRKQKEIEKNLIPALEDMLVQLNSGIPLFSIMVNISSSNYGALSDEFKKAVKKINSGFPQMDVLEEIGDRNPSLYFRRALWQISNGMRAGSDIGIVIKESVKSLNEEQILQIQNYGNKLNPLIMFYMLVTVIMPALAITFLTIITSLVNLPEMLSMILFVGLGVFVILIQIMFLGSIKSMRPSLL